MTYVNDEKWRAFHPNENFDEWLKWRQSVDRGETRSQMMTIIRPDFGYESPTTGNVITSEKARREDLARSECIEYDPEMKTDQKRRIEAEDAKLERDMDATVDKMIDTLPSDKRARLENEMASGLDVEISRQTV